MDQFPEIPSSSLNARKLANDTILSERYKILAHIADGGMASIYLAKDISGKIEEKIAIKVLHHSLLCDPTHVERFIQEAKVLTEIHHPMVIELLDIGQCNELVYFCMPYVNAPNLESVIYDGTELSAMAIHKILLSIVDGLKAIHEKGIIHRDLKPANILVLNDYSVKITDFGIARFRDSKLTAPKQKVGSLPYIAPESWLGEDPDPKMDMYALGVTLYEMLTKTNPFFSNIPMQVMKLHLGSAPLAPINVNYSCPKWASELTMWLLKKRPGQRPKNLDEITNYLHAAVTTNQDSPNILKPHNLGLSSKSQRSKTYVLSLNASSFSAKFDTVEGLDKPKRQRAPTVCIRLPRNSALVFEFEPPSRDIVCAGIFLASLQVLDGYLTSLGVSYFGTEREANLMLRNLMHKIGPNLTLILAKSCAILIVILLTAIARKQRALKKIINFLCGVYLVAAIIPWIIILTTEIK